MLFTIIIVTFVPGPVWPGFYAVSVLLVLVPFPTILGAVCMLVDPVPVGPVIKPVSIVAIAISMYEAAVSVCLVILPVPFILAARLPDLYAFAFP